MKRVRRNILDKKLNYNHALPVGEALKKNSFVDILFP
jgi:hypothetical protein